MKPIRLIRYRNPLTAFPSILPFPALSLPKSVPFNEFSKFPFAFGILTLLFLHGVLVFANPLVDVSLSDEQYQKVYDFIDRMVAKKAIDGIVKNTRPYSRGEVATALVALAKKVEKGDVFLSNIEHKRLMRLIHLFAADFKYPSEGSDANPDLPVPGGQTGEYLLQTRGEAYQFGVSLETGEIYNTVSGGIDVRNCPSDVYASNWEGACQKLTKERQAGYITLLRPTVIGQIKDSFAFYSDLKFYILAGDRFPDIPKTEVVQGQPGADFYTAALTTSYGKFKLPWFELLLGRENLSWGPGRHGALLISDNPLPMDMIKLSAWYNWIKFHAFTGILGGDISKKYLSGHRLEFNLWDRVSLGIAETMVYAGRFDITFSNPLQIYTVTGMLPKSVGGESVVSPDNGLDSADIDILLMKNLEIYGELMIDDFQPEFGLRSPFHWGSKWGILLGFYYIDPFSLPDTDVRVEYAFVNQYAYTHDPMDTTYTHFYHVIGHHIGADADDLFVDIRHRFTDKLQMALSYELERHGEGNVNKPHPQDAPWEEEWEFLSGVTESTNSLSLGLSYATIGRYFADLKYTVSWIENVQNKLNQNGTRHQFILEGSYRF
jgi:hypothetical protein